MKTPLQFYAGILCALFLSSSSVVWSNNIQIQNVRLTGQNTTSNFTLVEFDISWDNSWRLPTNTGAGNYDAAWVFVKFFLPDSVNPATGVPPAWHHAQLNFVNGTSDGHTAPSGSTINTPSDGMGVFIFRDTTGSGSVSWQNVQLRWNYGAQGFASTDIVDIRVYAIEMVYVPEGAFIAGDGNQAASFLPTEINTANASIAPSGTGGLGGTPQGGHPMGVPVPGPNYPNGFNDFYCMKYETSQEQYAEFLNTLTSTQSLARYPAANGTNRHTILGTNQIAGAPLTFAASAADRACNFLSWDDDAAYADWAGLRPMSELEYEKACRGPKNFVVNEFAWGHPGLYGTAYTLANDGAANASITNPSTTFFMGNASYSITDGALNGPLRCGIFAASVTNPTRTTAGAGYYGIHELSGNVQEPAVDIMDSQGAMFDGIHGDGVLDAAGNGNVANWPPNGTAIGTGSRGGSWATVIVGPPMTTPPNPLCISDRSAMGVLITTRLFDYGFRGVRTAP